MTIHRVPRAEHSLTALTAAVFLIGSTMLPGCKTTSSDPLELGRAWGAAVAEIPMADGSAGWQKFQLVRLLSDEDVVGVWPTVIFMHGCNGGNAGPLAKALVRNGFAVVTPNSLARQGYQGSCKEGRYNLRRDASEIRTADLTHAIEQTKQLSWVDIGNVFLVGHSEGGSVVAGFASGNPVHSVTARVVGGTDCGWRGVRAPRSEPVLAIMGRRDAVLVEIYGAPGEAAGLTSPILTTGAGTS